MTALDNTPDTATTEEPALKRFLGRMGPAVPIAVVLAIILVWIAFLNPNFTEPGPFLAFLRRAAPLLVLAVGQLFVIVSGGFDLSVGALITVTVVVSAAFSDGDPANTLPVLLGVLAIGALVGTVNGAITTRLKVPSFITTLGMLLVLRGAVNFWTTGAPRGALAENYRQFGRTGIQVTDDIQLPYAVLISLAVGAIAWFLLHRSTFGQQLYAAGGGAEAASLSGVNVPRVRTLAFIISGVAAAISGILLGGLAGVSAQVGQGEEFRAITAVVLGGAVLGGGKGQVGAVVLGALTLEALFTLLNLLGLPAPLRESVQGLIIIAAVFYAARRLKAGG